MIIDAHQHALWLGQNEADLVANLDANGIDLAWLLTVEFPPFEHAAKNHRSLNPCNVRADGTHAGVTLADQIRVRDRYPDRFVLGYCCHPALEGAADSLEQAHHMHGAQICGEWKFRILLDDPRCLNVFHVAGKLAMPVVLHFDVPYLPNADGQPIYQPLWYGGTATNLEAALKACPKTTFLGHGPGFWREISADADKASNSRPQGPVVVGGRIIELFDKYANLYGDLSAGSGLNALNRDPAHAKEFLTRFADRLLFARDCSDSKLHEFLQSLDLPEKISRKIYSQNALPYPCPYSCPCPCPCPWEC